MWFIRHFRNSQSRVLPHTYWTRIFIITSFSCGSYITKMGNQCMETQWVENRSKHLLCVNTLLPGTVSLLPEHKPPGMRPALMASMVSRPADDVMAIFRLANRPRRWDASAWCVYNYSGRKCWRWPAVTSGEGQVTGLAPGPPVSYQVPPSLWNDNQGFERCLASCKSKAFLWIVFWLFSCKPWTTTSVNVYE